MNTSDHNDRLPHVDPALEAEWERLEAERLAEERAEARVDAEEAAHHPPPKVSNRQALVQAFAVALAAGGVLAFLVNRPQPKPAADAEQMAAVRRAVDIWAEANRIDESACGWPAGDESRRRQPCRAINSHSESSFGISRAVTASNPSSLPAGFASRATVAGRLSPTPSSTVWPSREHRAMLMPCSTGSLLRRQCWRWMPRLCWREFRRKQRLPTPGGLRQPTTPRHRRRGSGCGSRWSKPP